MRALLNNFPPRTSTIRGGVHLDRVDRAAYAPVLAPFSDASIRLPQGSRRTKSVYPLHPELLSSFLKDPLAGLAGEVIPDVR